MHQPPRHASSPDPQPASFLCRPACESCRFVGGQHRPGHCPYTHHLPPPPPPLPGDAEGLPLMTPVAQLVALLLRPCQAAISVSRRLCTPRNQESSRHSLPPPPRGLIPAPPSSPPALSPLPPLGAFQTPTHHLLSAHHRPPVRLSPQVPPAQLLSLCCPHEYHQEEEQQQRARRASSSEEATGHDMLCQGGKHTAA